MMRYLAESADYKVYSLWESVYLRHKARLPWQEEYDPEDPFITAHYGEPTAALIMPDGQYIIVAGCGLSVYSVADQHEIHLLAEPDAITWTDGLHQDALDDARYEFRFVAYNGFNQLRVFRMSLLTQLVEELE